MTSMDAALEKHSFESVSSNGYHNTDNNNCVHLNEIEIHLLSEALFRNLNFLKTPLE